MERKNWKDHFDMVCGNIRSEVDTLVTLIKTMAKEVLEFEGVDNYIDLIELGDYTLGLDTEGENIVCWFDDWFCDIKDLSVDELMLIGEGLYQENYSVKSVVDS